MPGLSDIQPHLMPGLSGIQPLLSISQTFGISLRCACLLKEIISV